jgi:hypothetical protein
MVGSITQSSNYGNMETFTYLQRVKLLILTVLGNIFDFFLPEMDGLMETISTNILIAPRKHPTNGCD